ncbi:putative methyltransferase-domain-containing protein [Phascolomyces articulosus]|uniref:Methyltransferase-domain-containing protein n=1 Tax=Phascolomyces articulosus TaxID=60185 RepID=A0AAD5PJ67_9FUNG|nr:putative methyltransferase-domain-containing protein [Phascolomyces articulosus]
MTNLFYTRYLKPPPNNIILGKPFTIVWTVANDLGEISYWEPLIIRCRITNTSTASLQLQESKNGNSKNNRNKNNNKKLLNNEISTNTTTSVELEYDPVKGGGIMTNTFTVISSNPLKTQKNDSVTIQLVLELASGIKKHPIWTNARRVAMDDDTCCWIIPVYSLPMQILSALSTSHNNNSAREYERRVSIRSQKAGSSQEQYELLIHEDALPSIGSHIWDCGMLMCQYLAEKSFPYFDRILELGSGTAIAGIYAAHMLKPSAIYLTDLEETISTIEHNVSLLQGKHVNIVVKELEWGKPLPLDPNDKKRKRDAFDGTIDLVLLTDVLYNPSFHDALIDTLKQLMEINPKMKILLGYKPRDQGEERTFFDKIKKNLGWQWEMKLLPPAEIYWITSTT